MKRYVSEKKQIQRQERFDRNIKELASFLNKYKRCPEKSENPKIYAWVSSLINEYKRKSLEIKYVEQLDAIGFIWSRRDFNWFTKAEQVKQQLILEKTIPAYNKQPTLYYWLKSSIDLFHKNNFKGKQLIIIQEIYDLLKNIKSSSFNNSDIKIDAKEKKWNEKLNNLIEFRSQHPNHWPQFESTNEHEKKLGIWCQDLRQRFRKGLLTKVWILKLEQLGFNFQGKLDKLKERFHELKDFLERNQKLPGSKNTLYKWVRLQFNNYKNLSIEKQQNLNSIHFLKYLEEKNWDNKYVELQEFVAKHKTSPTKKQTQFCILGSAYKEEDIKMANLMITKLLHYRN
jgi:hypothetical protein